jgi:cytochrome c556
VKNSADLEKWYQYCAEMRDAAGLVNTAVRAGDHAKATSAMSRLANSCETCHQVFRKETK